MDYYPLPKVIRHPVPILTSDDILRIGNEPYVPAGRRFDGYDFVHEEHPDRMIFLRHADINDRLDAETARLEYGGNKPEVQFLELLFKGRTFNEFNPKVQRVARLRVRLFEKFDEECLTVGTIARSSETFQTWIDPRWKKLLSPVRSDSVNNVAAPSVSTFNRLYKEWRNACVARSGGLFYCLDSRIRPIAARQVHRYRGEPTILGFWQGRTSLQLIYNAFFL